MVLENIKHKARYTFCIMLILIIGLVFYSLIHYVDHKLSYYNEKCVECGPVECFVEICTPNTDATYYWFRIVSLSLYTGIIFLIGFWGFAKA